MLADPETDGLVAHLLEPVGPPAFGSEVEEVPQRLEGANVARVLLRTLWCIEKFRTPEMADYWAVAVEHVQHWLLVAFPGLRPVVAVIGVASRGQEPEPPPSALLGERHNAPYRRFPDDGEVDALPRHMLGRSVELVEESGARWAGAFRQGQQRCWPAPRAEAVVVLTRGNIML